MKRRCLSGRLLILVSLSVTILVAVLATAGCSSPSPATTISTTPSLAEFPPGKPVDVIRRTSPPYVWNAVVADHTVAYVESDSYGFPYLAQPQPPQTAVVKMLDLETGEVSAVTGGELTSPKYRNSWPWWFLAELPQAKSGTGPSVVWALGDTHTYGGTIVHWQGFTGWNSSPGTKPVLSPETMILPPIRTGDILALPLTSFAFESAHLGQVGATLGEKLLVLTPSLDQPIAVDPAAPILPAAALEGISPYVSWSGRSPNGYEGTTQDANQFRGDLPGKPPRVFDLRSGKLVDIAVKDPRTPDMWGAVTVAGHWVAWQASEGNPRAFSLYLADLSTGQGQRIGEAIVKPALSKSWLLWTDPSGTLLGYHLPDLAPVRLAGALAADEKYAKLQISGDLPVLMVVNQEPNAIGPDLPPTLTAIRVVRLR